MRKTAFVVLGVLLASLLSPASALQVKGETKSAFARGTVTGTSWAIDYPDFAQAISEEKWSFFLKGINGNTVGGGDTAEFTLTDANGKELLKDFGFSSGANGTIEFWDYIRGSKFASIDLTRPFKGTIKVTRGFGSALKDALVTVTIPVVTFPKRPVASVDYVSLVTKFDSIAFPKSCASTEFQFNVNDPYSEISTVKFTVVDTAGKEVASSTQFSLENGIQKDDIQLCPYDLDGTLAPYTFVTNISFESSTGKLALAEKTAFPLASKKDEAVAKATSMGDFCSKGTSSKIVSAGSSCPSGFRKINFEVPSDLTWNSLTRIPNSQKNKNFIVYACVAQFDANTGGSKFRGYASPVQQQYYFANGVNAIFTGSAKSLLKLSEKTAFIAKVTVNGGVVYTTLGGRTSVPSLAIRQYQAIGSC